MPRPTPHEIAAAIAAIQDRVRDHWRIDLETYPAMPLGEAAARERDAFLLTHASLHLSKQAGKVAGLIESIAHGGAFDRCGMEQQLGYTLIDILQLANLVGIDEYDFMAVLREWEEAATVAPAPLPR